MAIKKRRKKRKVKNTVDKLVIDKTEESNILVNELPANGDDQPQEAQIVQEERKPGPDPAPIQKKSKTHFTPSKMLNLRGKDPNKVYYGVNKNMLGRVQRKLDEGMVLCTDQSLVNSSDNIATGSKIGSHVEIGDLIILEASKEWGKSREAYYKSKIRGKKDLQKDYMNKSDAGYGTIS